MQKHNAVVVSLHSPKEKLWGVLLSLDVSGVTLRGIDLHSFDDWSREITRGEASMGLSTVFFPMHRVERILLDEGVGGIQSMTAVFESRVGQDLWTYLEISPPEV
jgi:hypothetical protein